MEYLSELIIRVDDIAKMIQFATRLVEQLQSNPELMEKHQGEIKDLIEEYNMEVALLRKELERYFEFERRQNFPVNLSLRKAYSELRNL